MTNLWLTILCTLFTGKVIGHQHKAHASHKKNHRRQHQAHVHGQGELQMVFDSKKNEIAIKLTAPMEDIAGFEHEPKTSAQLKTLQAQAQKIKNAKVAVFDEASNCSRKSLEVTFPVKLAIKETAQHSNMHQNKETNMGTNMNTKSAKRVQRGAQNEHKRRTNMNTKRRTNMNTKGQIKHEHSDVARCRIPVQNQKSSAT